MLHPAPNHPLSISSIMVELYSIIVTLIKVPNPDPFPEGSLQTLPQPRDNGLCYSREQGPTVNRLLAYSPGLIIPTLWWEGLLEKAWSLGSTGLTQVSLAVLRRLSMDPWQSNGEIQRQH